MKHKRGEPPYIYGYIYCKIKEKRRTPIISTHDLLKVMRTHIKMNKNFNYPTICQMEEHGFIKRISKHSYQILKNPFEKKINELMCDGFWEF